MCSWDPLTIRVKCESCISWGLLHDFEIFANLRLKLYWGPVWGHL